MYGDSTHCQCEDDDLAGLLGPGDLDLGFFDEEADLADILGGDDSMVVEALDGLNVEMPRASAWVNGSDEDEVGFIDTLAKAGKILDKAVKAVNKPSRRRANRNKRRADQARREVSELERKLAQQRRQAERDRRREQAKYVRDETSKVNQQLETMRSEQVMLRRKAAQARKKRTRRALMVGGGVAAVVTTLAVASKLAQPRPVRSAA